MAHFAAHHAGVGLDGDDLGDARPGVDLNTSWDIEKLEKKLPNHVKKLLAKKNIKLYTIDATDRKSVV